MKLGVYIGSFNPVHKGHIHVVNYLLEKNVVDKVLLVPTGNYWNKKDLVDIKDRINMLKFYENEFINIDTENNSILYTYLLMRKLKDTHPNDTLYLVIGADNIIDFNKWKNYEELLDYNIIIMNRDDIDIDKYLVNYPNNHFIILRDFHPINVSSTDIRNGKCNELLDEEVKQYIKKNNLYK